MHLGYNNPSYEYLMNDEVLIDTEEERDLGVTILRFHVTSPILGEHISVIVLPQQHKQWLSVE